MSSQRRGNTETTNFYNERHDGKALVRFFAIADTQDYDCAITVAALQGHLKGYGRDSLVTFRANSQAIMRVVDYKIKQGVFEEGKTIMLRTQDFPT